MHLSWMIILAQSSAPNQASDSSIVTLSYVIGAFAAVAGILGGFQRFYSKQKQRWTEEGESRAKQAQILEQNTRAVTDLTKKMDEFVASMGQDIAGLTARINHLERRRPGG